MNTIASLRTEDESVAVEYEVISTVEPSSSDEHSNIQQSIAEIDKRLAENEAILDQMNRDIDRLTNHADGFDYAISVCSGILCGFIDSFYVGEFNFQELKADANKHANKFVEKYAKISGWDGNGCLNKAVEFLENKYPVAQDNIWKGEGISSTKLHHLEDLAHHPTPAGLVFAIMVSFLNCSFFINKRGEWNFKALDFEPKELARLWTPLLISGVLRWLVYVAESKYFEKEGTKLPKPITKLLKLIAYTPGIIQILKVSINWAGHLVSDMAGSKNTPGGGMGIPGLFISLLKELSSLPLLKDTNLPKVVSDLYSKGKIDLRAELAITEFIGKQSVPVIINECIVRTFYFVRHLIKEKKDHEQWKDVNWNNVVPWGNRTINRMLTIATGTFTAFDVADAAVRSAIKNGGNIYNPKLYLDFILRVNFVGIGRFAIAIGTDIYMGCKRQDLMSKRLYLQSEQVLLNNSKVFYKEADMWVSAKETAEALVKMEEEAEAAMRFLQDSLIEISQSVVRMSSYKEGIEKNNPLLLDDISNILKYGK
jgi:hypothetical protein